MVDANLLMSFISYVALVKESEGIKYERKVGAKEINDKATPPVKPPRRFIAHPTISLYCLIVLPHDPIKALTSLPTLARSMFTW